MKRILGIAMILSQLLITGASSLRAEGKMVFAHYTICHVPPGPGATVEGYKAEISEAQKRGIDGFALNSGGWSVDEPYYKERTLLMYQAAEELGTGFQLMNSADFCTTLSLEEAKDMVETFRDHPNQFRKDGKPVLSTWLGDAETTRFMRSEFTGDHSIFFVPFYYPKPAHELPNDAAVDQVFQANQALDGFFYFGASGTPASLNAATARIAKKWKDAGKLFMAPISPYYRGPGGNYRAFEYRGFEGMASQWETAIQSGADWVEIVTWNDWGECSYVSPFGPPEETDVLDGHYGKLLSHNGFLDASRYYIDWFKTGKKPEIAQDSLFYFYRLHPKNVPGFVDPRPHRDPSLPERGRPDGVEKLEDQVYATVFLTAPAVLKIRVGEQSREFPLPGGVNHVSLPIGTGYPQFTLTRDGVTIIDKKGEFSISEENAWGNYNYFSGSASAPGEKLKS